MGLSLGLILDFILSMDQLLQTQRNYLEATEIHPYLSISNPPPHAHTGTDAYRIITVFLHAGDFMNMALIINQARIKENTQANRQFVELLIFFENIYPMVLT